MLERQSIVYRKKVWVDVTLDFECLGHFHCHEGQHSIIFSSQINI